MKAEYDFSKAERGKFYRKDGTLNLPVYLDEDIRNYLTGKAKNKGVGVSQMVNELLRKEISLIEEMK